MERDGWMKSIIHFKIVCGSNNINKQVLLYDGHVSHFENRAIYILLYHHIKTFTLKAGDSGNDQTNDRESTLLVHSSHIRHI